MADQRFFRRPAPILLRDLLGKIAAEPIASDAEDILIDDLSTLEQAGPSHIAVFSDGKYRASFEATAAGAVLTTRELAERSSGAHCCVIFVKDPRLAFAQVGHIMYPRPDVVGGIDPAARLDPTAVIGPGTRIDPGAVIGERAEIGARCHIGANVTIGPGVVLGDDCRVGASTAVSHALIGARVEISTGVSVGGPGFGFVAGPTGLLRMLQLGRVIIEDDVEIGSNCSVDRGATGDTVIGAGTVIDNLVQIGHNVRIGRHCVLSGQVGIAGSTTLGDGVMVGGQTAISDHLVIGTRARIAGKSGVMRDVPPGATIGGYPAMPIRQWHRQTLAMQRATAPAKLSEDRIPPGDSAGQTSRNSDLSPDDEARSTQGCSAAERRIRSQGRRDDQSR